MPYITLTPHLKQRSTGSNNSDEALPETNKKDAVDTLALDFVFKGITEVFWGHSTKITGLKFF